MSKNIGQQIVVENRPGAGGAVAAGIVRANKPNGYTLMLTSSVYVVTPSLKKPSPYDPLKDFIPICEIGDAPNVIVVKADSPIKNLNDLIMMARKDPKLVSYGSPGPGTTPHLAGEVLKIRENIMMTHIPYKGAGPAMTDLLGGQTQVLFGSLASVMGQIQGGLVRPIAQTGERRWPDLANLPTLADLGIKDAVSSTFQAIFVNAGCLRCSPTQACMLGNYAVNDLPLSLSCGISSVGLVRLVVGCLILRLIGVQPFSLEGFAS
jgi:tripartite-type tricarboxylate transporter receptor subunit TctC